MDELEFDSISDLIDSINERINSFIDKMAEVNAKDLGLDRRAGHSLYIDDTTIAVRKINDNSLRYYGGFEYVDKSCRIEMGDWVFYLNEDNRVEECLLHYNEEKEEKNV